MTDIVIEIDPVIAKLEKALGQIEDKLKRRPGDQALEMAKASVESAIEDLLGFNTQ